ncbi:MAG TPA: ribonuclease P protein component [Phenylobacterium sp.]|uniref:ribonuclease P protein component n=1 Tax=Phenylobacterium sp. TaxID=1871053 RepID=UPI002C969CEC|nr:ribonuclease P protein component [Phenylobacterium sp.]
MTDAPFKIERLRKRPDFLAAARASSFARGAVVVQMRRRGDDDAGVRVGFTATRKIGGAVVRNRAKRRLRAAAQQLIPQFGAPGCDYVLIARSGAPTRPWARLLDDVKSALISLATESERQATASATSPSPPA